MVKKVIISLLLWATTFIVVTTFVLHDFINFKGNVTIEMVITFGSIAVLLSVIMVCLNVLFDIVSKNLVCIKGIYDSMTDYIRVYVQIRSRIIKKRINSIRERC